MKIIAKHFQFFSHGNATVISDHLIIKMNSIPDATFQGIRLFSGVTSHHIIWNNFECRSITIRFTTSYIVKV